LALELNLLSKETVNSAKVEWRNVKKESKAVQLSRLKRDVTETLNGLAVIANCQSVKERQLAGMLSAETLRPFMKALLHPKGGVWPDTKTGPPFTLPKDKKSQREWERRRKRIQAISSMMMQELWIVSGVIAPVASSVLVRKGNFPIEHLTALMVGY
jgi:hypothetical protein